MIDDEGILGMPSKDALHLSITELDIDSLKLLDFSYMIEKEFNLRINFESITSKSTLNDLFEDMISIPK
jgi:acyl carrier protein